MAVPTAIGTGAGQADAVVGESQRDEYLIIQIPRRTKGAACTAIQPILECEWINADLGCTFVTRQNQCLVLTAGVQRNSPGPAFQAGATDRGGLWEHAQPL